MGRNARVVIDSGDAFIESGRAVGGVILEMDLRFEGGHFSVSQLGFAVFPD